MQGGRQGRYRTIRRKEVQPVANYWIVEGTWSQVLCNVLEKKASVPMTSNLLRYD